MNRHFTETSKQLAQDKAEADAALADLERRRAQTSEFVPSNSGDLNPFDSLYVELQQKRADCRRKERETMLLYQRYVHKFQKSKATPATSKTVEKKATPPVQEVDEDIYNEEEPELVHETPQKDPRDGLNVSFDESSTPEAAAPPPSSPPTVPIEDSSSVQDPPDVSPPTTHDDEDVLESSVEEEKKIPDVPDLKSTSMPQTVPEDKSIEQELVEEKHEPEPQEEPLESSLDEAFVVDDSDDDAVNPTESVTEPVETPAPAVEVAPAVEAPQDEEEETALTPVLNSVSSESFSVNRPTAEVTADFPPGTASEEDSDDDDNRSVISGLTTVNSALTRQVMDRLESEMEFFIKNETEAIQKLLDEEEEGGPSLNASFGGSRLSSDASVACDKSVVASLKAEQMAEEMQKMLEQFEKDDKSSVETSKSAAGDVQKNSSSSITQSLYPRTYKSPNPNEDWMVYWDEKFEREYYYEKNSNTTQWEAPVMKLGFKDNPDFTPKEMPKRTSSLIIEKKLSRSEIYKKKLRKRRMQRAALIFVILGSLLLSAVHWKTNHAEKSYPDAMKATYIDLKDIYEYKFTNRTAEEQEAADLAKREREQKAREAEERERKRKAAEAAEAERLRLEQVRVQEEAERKRKAAEEAEKEAEKLRKLAAEKKAAEEKAAREREAAREKAAREQRFREEEEARLRKEAQERKAEEARLEAERLAKLEEEMRRPWGCNLPFSHVVHGRCRKLAKINPIYNEDYLLNSFLQ